MSPKGSPSQRRRNSRAPLIAGDGPLAKVPPVVAFLLVIVLFGLGVWLRGPIGAALLVLLALGVGLLLATTWQILSTADRVLRILVVAILVIVAVSVLR